MEVKSIEPPREFLVGDEIELRHCADVTLATDEQVTFVTASGTEFDVVRKAWGYYGTPSLNRRLPSRGLRPVIALGDGAIYLLLVESGEEEELKAYVDVQDMELLLWLDSDDALAKISSVCRCGEDHPYG